MIEPEAGLRIPEGAIPTEQKRRLMERAHALVQGALSEVDPQISSSPVGPGWSSDVDVHVRDADRAAILAARAGWIPLSSIDRHLGYPDSDGYAIVDGHSIIARADVHASPAPDALAKVISRAERLGEPDVRTVLELRSLLPFDEFDSSTLPVLARAAEVERTMGGDLLDAWLGVQTSDSHPRGDRRGRKGPRPQARIAISGVDGAGKSTLIDGLQLAFDRCGMPSDVIWTRPGMGLKRLDAVAKLVRRWQGEGDPGIQQLAEGGDPTAITSRRGAVGWLWLTLVTMAFLSTVWRETGRARGVVIYDRHLLDALGTIDVFYRGVDSRLHRRVVRALMPSADLGVWLAVDPRAAVSRKPGDMIGHELVAAQHESYVRHAPSVQRLMSVDATKPPEDILLEVLAAFDDALSARRPRVTTVLITWLRRVQSAIRDR